jgi:hypothetical protein
MSLEAADQQFPETTNGSGAATTANTGWFASLFGWFSRDNSIPNVNSNGSDVPLPDYGSASKYSLPFWGGKDGGAVNAAPPSNQGFFSKIWQSDTAKFIFCPIFRDCPEGVPPGGYTPVEDALGAAGKAVGQGASAALGPIFPILIVLAAILLLANILLPRLAGSMGAK